MSFTAILALAAAATPQADPAPPAVMMAQARASVRILKAERIDVDAIARGQRADVAVRQDAVGTAWIEYS